jgi:two-component system phosphate regulon sensor histidine kinase PhoR
MKRIFPVITVLIALSLLGLIFFQFLWLKSAKEIKEQQLGENIAKAANAAGIKLMEDNSFLPRPKKNNLLFPSPA